MKGETNHGNNNETERMQLHSRILRLRKWCLCAQTLYMRSVHLRFREDPQVVKARRQRVMSPTPAG